MTIKIKTYFFALLINLSFYQVFSQDPIMDRFNATNHTWLQKLSLYDINIEGSPYLNENFSNGNVVLDSLNSFSGRIRIDAYAQKFQTLNKSGQIFEVVVDENDYVEIENKTYRLHKFQNKTFGDYGILRECIILQNISLYFYPRKKLKKPIEAGRTVADSGYGKTARPEWVDDSTYLLLIDNKYIKLPQNHKKIVELEFIKKDAYKAFRKENKINLKKEEDIVKLVRFFNSKV